MEKKARIRYSQSFPNVKKKYTYVSEIDEIVLNEDVEDLWEYHESFRHTCLKDTLQRFLGEDYQKLYGEQQIVIDDKNVADEYTKLDKIEFYTEMTNFVNDMRKKYNLPLAASLSDTIEYLSKNADKYKKDFEEMRKKENEKIQGSAQNE